MGHAADPETTLSRTDLAQHPVVLLHLLDTVFTTTLSAAISRNPTQIGIIQRRNLWVQKVGTPRMGLALGMAASRSSNYVTRAFCFYFAPSSGRFPPCGNKDGNENEAHLIPSW